VRNLAASHSQRHDGIVDLDGGPQLHTQQLGQVTLNRRDRSVVIFYTTDGVRPMSYGTVRYQINGKLQGKR
jgi:hypothetical protein